MRAFTLSASLACLLSACAANHPDHLYVLSTLPQGTGGARTIPALQVVLKTTLPSLVDRSEMVVSTSTDKVIALEHERWAAPLADLVTQTLARDIETRRRDVLIGGQGIGRSSIPTVAVSVDLVQVIVRQGDAATIETRWRIVDARGGQNTIGGESFSAPLQRDDYASVAHALSACVALLADRLALLIPRGE